MSNISSATRDRTWDILVTLILKFLKGVDYIIILLDVRRFLRFYGVLPEGIVSEPSPISWSLAADYPIGLPAIHLIFQLKLP